MLYKVTWHCVRTRNQYYLLCVRACVCVVCVLCVSFVYVCVCVRTTDLLQTV